jgi:2-oxoisovalerate dehydrogenase E1 component
LNELIGNDLEKPLHLAKMINMGLNEIVERYPSAVIIPEDVAQKGGVYNVTEGLYKKFGARRIFNSPLDEQTILGTAIGFAQNGFLPIPEIQFLAYVHNAEDQIRGEAATLAFFSQGQFTNGMIVRIAGLPYQKGFGGHFHNDNSLSIFRDIPGVIIAVPSNGADAVKMLRTCAEEAWERGRVVIFIEPIALYMTRDLNEAGDKGWATVFPASGEKIKLGEFGVWGESKELTLITYGNGTYYSRQAAEELEKKHKTKVKIIDLRWIAPLNKEALLDEIGDCPNVLIVDECRKTGSLSEWICAMLLENAVKVPRVKIVAADDCFIPLGKAAAAGLPSKDEIVHTALKLLNKV